MSRDTRDQVSKCMHCGKMNMLSVEFKERSKFCETLWIYNMDIMADPEPSTPQISQASGDGSVIPPLVKMIGLEELEQTVLGLGKKSFEQAYLLTGD